MINGSQQQFIVRNSNIDDWTNGVWNQVFSGDIGAAAQSFGVTPGTRCTTLADQPSDQGRAGPVTPTRGQYHVFVPAVRHDSSGPAWASGAEAGQAMPIFRGSSWPARAPRSRPSTLRWPGPEPGPDARRLRPGSAHRRQPPRYRCDGPGVRHPRPQHGNAAMIVAAEHWREAVPASSSMPAQSIGRCY